MADNRYRVATFQLTIQKEDRHTVQQALREIGMPTHATLLIDQTPTGSTSEERNLRLDWDLSTINEDLSQNLDDFGANEQLADFDYSDAIARLRKIYDSIRTIPGVSYIYITLGDQTIYN